MLRTQPFPSLAARGTFVADANLASLTQGNVDSIQKYSCQEMILNQAKNILASRTQLLLPKQMFPNLVTLEATTFPETMLPSLARP